MKVSTVGGQGVLEGVMMRAPEKSALAVRGYDGIIVTKEWPTKSYEGRSAFFRAPIIRGVVSFVDMMVVGVTTITDAAKLLDDSAEYEPSKFETFIARKTGKNIMDVVAGVAVVIAVVLAVGLFFVLPNVVTGFFRPYVSSSIGMNFIDGGFRLLLFLAYLMLISCMKDIKRMFKYHGAEHRTINCYEHELPLTVENVQKQTRLHPRCGTSYMLIVMVLAILVFSLFGWTENPFLRVLIRLALLPVVAGISYEILKAAARHDNLFWRAVRWPGMQLQRLTTKPPDDEMAEVAIVAFQMALGELSQEELTALMRSYDRPVPKDESAEASAADAQTAVAAADGQTEAPAADAQIEAADDQA